jgi:hypothetical protein
MIDTATQQSNIATPSNMADADWRSFFQIDRINLKWTPQSITDGLKIAPTTIRRLLGLSETKLANAERHIRSTLFTNHPSPCEYIKVNKVGFGMILMQTDQVDSRKTYGSNEDNPNFVPSEMAVTTGYYGREQEFYTKLGLSEEQHRFPIVDVENPRQAIVGLQ